MSKHSCNQLYGIHAVQAALNNPKRKCYELWGTKEILASLQIPPSLKTKRISRHELSHHVGEGVTHQGALLMAEPLAGVHLETYLKRCPEQTLCVVLDQVTDPHNIGAILRSAAAFGASALIYPEKNAPDPQNSIIAKVAAGAVEYIPIITVTNLSRTLESLKQNRFWCTGLDERGQNIADISPFSERTALVFGAEGKGLRRLTQKLCDYLVSLPTNEFFPTLNVSNAAAIALYEARRYMLQKGSNK